MPTTTEVARTLLSRCLEKGHKPGKLQFTKYLYLLDYCNWRLRGAPVTTIEWIFYHYGPWSPAAESCMQEMAAEYGIAWRDDEWTAQSRFDTPAPRLGLHIESLINSILEAFRNLDPNRLLEYVYTQTEPMLQARRGDRLDFRAVPVTGEMPVFTPLTQDPTLFPADTTLAARLEQYRQRLGGQQARAAAHRRARQRPSYQAALELLAEEMDGPSPLNGAWLSLSAETAAALARE